MKIQVYDVSLKPAPLSKTLTVDEVSGQPQTGEPQNNQPTALPPLGNLIAPGNEFYLKPLGLLGRLNLPTTPVGLGLPLGTFGAPVGGAPAGTPNSPKIVKMATGSLDPTAKSATGENKNETWAKALGHVSAGGIAAGSFHLMSVTQDMTQAHVVGQLQTMGMGPGNADAWASHMFDVMNTQGAHAVLAGVTVGSATVEFLGLVRPTMPMPKRIAIGCAVAVVAGLLFFLFAYKPSPFDGKWVASPSEARYEFGAAPQSATCTISADGTRLTFSEDDMLPNGTIEHQKYKLDADGKEHKAPAGLGADTVVASIADRSMAVVFKNGGKEVRDELRNLSADRKEMTVTVSGTGPDGKAYQNTSVYEKK